MPASASRSVPILLTGATGYIGGRLLRRLEEEGRPVRCLTRRPEVLAQSRLASSTSVVEGDALAAASLADALAGVTVAYYLVHSMAARGDFESLDRRAATNFAAAARKAGVSQIVYLGVHRSYEELDELMTRFCVSCCVVDAMPEPLSVAV